MGLGKSIFNGMIWSAIERVSIQAVQFILGVILARLLDPKEYGIIGILLVFTALSYVFIDSGFTKALIQKKDRDEDDKSTVFLFNIAISLFFYGVLWVMAPSIAKFYEIDILSSLLRVLALSLIIDAFFSVPSTMITIAMNFKLFAKINLITTTISGGIAIILAYKGYGVWALVFQTLIKSSITAFLIWSLLKWKPNFRFSKASFNELFSFGSKLLISNLMAAFSSQLNALLIGKYIGTKDLGFYSRGIHFSDVVYGVFSSAINNVLLPGLAPIQDQRAILINHTRTIIKTSAVIIVPVFLLLSVLAEPIIRILLTEKWILAAPIMQLFCIARLVSIISGINVNLLYVIGKTNLVLKQQYYNIAIRIILLLAALKFGIFYIALAELVSTLIHFFINSYYPGKIMSYGAFKQIKDLLPILFSGLVMTLFASFVLTFVQNPIIELLVASVISIVVYLGMIYLLNVREVFILYEKLVLFFKK